MSFLTEFQQDFLIGKPFDATACDITEQEHKQINDLFMQFFESICERLRNKQKDISEEDATEKKADDESENLDKEKKKLKQWKRQYDSTKE